MFGCVKKKIELDKVEAPVLDPSFAAPLGQVNLTMSDIEQQVDEDDFVYNQADNAFELIYPDRLFEFGINDMLSIPTQTFSYGFGMPGGSQGTFTGGGVGTQVTFNDQNDFVYSSFTNGELLDSVIIANGQLTIDLSSDFSHSGTVTISIPSLTNGGVPYQTTLNLNYGGSVPVTDNAIVDISGYTLDLTKGGITDNTVEVAYSATMTNSGAGVSGGEQLNFTFGLSINQFSSVWGYFGQYVNILDQDTSYISLFEDIQDGILHFADPRVELFIYNTAGIEVHTDFNAVWAPDNSVTVNLGGSGLTSIPNIVAAPSPGNVGVTTHIISNANTVPTLTDLLDEGPSNVVYSAVATTNPNGVTQNFLLDTSKVWCDGRIILPFYGYADNFTLVDTTDADIEEMLGIDSSSNISVEDVEQVLVRLIVDNGLPTEAGVQLYFADTNGVIIDSLFQQVGYENIFEPGLVNFNLPVSDPNYGKVYESTRKITDIVITQDLLQKLLDNESKKIIYKGIGYTSGAGSQLDVKIFPEYTIGIKVSAKVDLMVDLNQ